MTETAQASEASGPIVARAGAYYRRARYIMTALLIAGGMWFGYDGWFGWPEENRMHEELTARRDQAAERALSAENDAEREAADQERLQLVEELKEYEFHGPWNIFLQKVLFVTLPVLGLGLLGWTLYNSRGAYRLEGSTLAVPGHPPIDLDQVTRIDKQLWDRKGIAYIEYDAGGQSGRIRLDDFVYEAQPTRDIFERVEAHTLARVAEAMDPAPEDASA